MVTGDSKTLSGVLEADTTISLSKFAHLLSDIYLLVFSRNINLSRNPTLEISIT
jgi:hypothetical protein